LIIGITGLCVDSAGNTRTTGAGKDTVADVLTVLRGTVKMAFADSFKRIVKDTYGFSYDQLWGPSHLREEPDPRYLRMAKGELGTMNDAPNPKEDVYLTPRFALLQFGSTAGRACYVNTWTDYGVRTALQLLRDPTKIYIDHIGLVDKDALLLGVESEEKLEALEEEIEHYPENPEHVVFSDVRFFNEVAAIRYNGGKIVRVLRNFPGVFEGDFSAKHESESQVANMPDDEFDYVIENDANLELLQLNTLRMFDVITGRVLAYDEAQANIPPFMRKKV
jgi:hypothetical protein